MKHLDRLRIVRFGFYLKKKKGHSYSILLISLKISFLVGTDKFYFCKERCFPMLFTQVMYYPVHYLPISTHLRPRSKDLGEYCLDKCNTNWVTNSCKGITQDKLSYSHCWNVVTPCLNWRTAYYFSFINSACVAVSFIPPSNWKHVRKPKCRL